MKEVKVIIDGKETILKVDERDVEALLKIINVFGRQV